jgi:hypothetical protein
MLVVIMIGDLELIFDWLGLGLGLGLLDVCFKSSWIEDFAVVQMGSSLKLPLFFGK